MILTQPLIPGSHSISQSPSDFISGWPSWSTASVMSNSLHLPELWLKLRPPEPKLGLEILDSVHVSIHSLKSEAIHSSSIDPITHRLGTINSAKLTPMPPVLSLTSKWYHFLTSQRNRSRTSWCLNNLTASTAHFSAFSGRSSLGGSFTVGVLMTGFGTGSVTGLVLGLVWSLVVDLYSDFDSLLFLAAKNILADADVPFHETVTSTLSPSPCSGLRFLPCGPPNSTTTCFLVFVASVACSPPWSPFKWLPSDEASFAFNDKSTNIASSGSFAGVLVMMQFVNSLANLPLKLPVKRGGDRVVGPVIDAVALTGGWGGARGGDPEGGSGGDPAGGGRGESALETAGETDGDGTGEPDPQCHSINWRKGQQRRRQYWGRQQSRRW